MKKLGYLLAVVAFSQGINADPVGANLYALVAETGASADWTAVQHDINVDAQEKLNVKIQELNNKLDKQLTEHLNKRVASAAGTL